jgi:Ca-activated chloride channel homolog
LPAGDVVRLLLFSGKPRWIAERPEPLAKSRASLTASVESSFADGGTALYDAIVAAYRPAAGEPKGAARAVIVLTDGQDTDSVLKLEELMDQLRRQASGEGTDASAPRLFTIAYGDKADAGVLKQLAEAGGGGFFSGTPKDIQAVYAELATFF